MKENEQEHKKIEVPVQGSDKPVGEARSPSGDEMSQPVADPLEAAQQETAYWKDLYLRQQADLDNLRKFLERRSAEQIEEERQRLIQSFLPIFDHLEMALAHADGDPQALRQGIELTYKEFLRILEREGVTPIETEGQPFDPALHEAVDVISDDTLPPQTIVEEIRKGFRYRDKLLRPAKVRVNR